MDAVKIGGEYWLEMAYRDRRTLCLSIVGNIMGNFNYCEDVIHDTMIQLLAIKDKITSFDMACAYLHRTVRFKAMAAMTHESRLRNRERIAVEEMDLVSEQTGGVFQYYPAKDKVFESFHKLSGIHKEALTGHLMAVPVSDMSRAFGYDPRTTKVFHIVQAAILKVKRMSSGDSGERYGVRKMADNPITDKVVSMYDEGMAMAQIADELGMPLRTVYSKVKERKKFIKKYQSASP